MNQSDHAAFMPHVSILDRTRLRLLWAGRGDPVVFLHGVGGFKELWWSTIHAIAPEYRAFAFDWPGHGSPPLPSHVPLLEELARRTIESCDELGLERITLVGHSLGGNVAARVALARPDLVTRLALIDAAIHSTHLPLSGRLYVDPRWSKHTARAHARITAWLGHVGADVPHIHHGGLIRPWARRCHYMARTDEHVLQSFVRAIYQGSLGDEIRRIRHPTLVLTGSRDMLVRPRQAREIATMIPHARLVILRGAYHNPMDERPAQFQRALLQFLRGTNPAGN